MIETTGTIESPQAAPPRLENPPGKRLRRSADTLVLAQDRDPEIVAFEVTDPVGLPAVGLPIGSAP